MSIQKYMKQYNELSDKEKIKRLEIVAQAYAGWLSVSNYKESPFLDCTKYWDEFKENNKQGE